MKAERMTESQAESEIQADERRYVALMPVHEARERLLAQSIKLRRVTRKLTAERARAEKALKLASIITCDIEGECIVDLAVYRQRIKELDCERMGRDEN